MLVSKEIMNKIEGKLRRPVHINYIANYIVKLSIGETRNLLTKLIDLDVIVESNHAKDYFVLKSKK
jgi:hypothetical protein